MALIDDLTASFADFGVTATSGGVTGVVILDQPDEMVLDGQVIFRDYNAHANTSEFGSLTIGSTITISSVDYEVRSVDQDLDGLTCQIALSKA